MQVTQFQNNWMMVTVLTHLDNFPLKESSHTKNYKIKIY